MSSKSKHPPKRMNQTQVVCNALALFLYTWVDEFNPSRDDVQKLSGAIRATVRAIRDKAIDYPQMLRQLEVGYGITTDWARRDRK